MKLPKKTKPFQARPYLLYNPIQHYAWGGRGKEAFIPRFLDIEPQADKPYAELWIGAHPKAPSKIKLNESYFSLDKLISQYPYEILGKHITQKFSGKLPFLFKVLSAAQALSIQAHPNKDQAQALHQRDSDHYPDDNHKPEIAIALDSLTALVGFKSFDDIINTVKKYPEISAFIGGDIFDKLKRLSRGSYDEQRDALRFMYSTLMQRSITCEKELTQSIDRLEKRLTGSSNTLSEKEHLFLNLNKIYKSDAGLFSIFLLNMIHLKEGQGVFLKAGIPHAYLKGNIVECMANSDNVVRAGLTPKFKDVETLVEILTYDTKPIPIMGTEADEIIYHTPAAEFEVTRWKMKSGQKKYQSIGNKPQVLLITEGNIFIDWNTDVKNNQEKFRRGQSILIPAALKEFTITAENSVTLFKVEIPEQQPQ